MDLTTKTATELKTITLDAMRRNDRTLLGKLGEEAKRRMAERGLAMPTKISQSTIDLYRTEVLNKKEA